MRRAATWLFYVIGAVAIGYLALYAYATLMGREFVPGDPIHIYRRPDAPNYSGRDRVIAGRQFAPNRDCPAAFTPLPRCAGSRSIPQA
jgi:hypothetical protein